MIKLKFKGQKEISAKLKAFAQAYPKRVKQALVRGAERIMTRSKRDFVPVGPTGNLKNSGHVEVDQSSISVTLVYGGPAAAYAVRQHEELSYKHRVGQAKYLEQPLLEAAPTLLADIAREEPIK